MRRGVEMKATNRSYPANAMITLRFCDKETYTTDMRDIPTLEVYSHPVAEMTKRTIVEMVSELLELTNDPQWRPTNKRLIRTGDTITVGGDVWMLVAKEDLGIYVGKTCMPQVLTFPGWRDVALYLVHDARTNQTDGAVDDKLHE